MTSGLTYKCRICKDTGEILLLNSFVSCDCKKIPNVKTAPVEQVDPALKPPPSITPENCYILRYMEQQVIEYYIIFKSDRVFGLPATTRKWAGIKAYAGIIEIPLIATWLLSKPEWAVFDHFNDQLRNQIVPDSWDNITADPTFQTRDGRNLSHYWTPAYVLRNLTNNVFTL